MSTRTILIAALAAVAGFAIAFGFGWALSDRSSGPPAPEAAQPARIPDPGGIAVKATLATAAPIPDLKDPPVVVIDAPSTSGGSSAPTTSGGSSAPSSSGGSSAPSNPGGSAPSAPASDGVIIESQ